MRIALVHSYYSSSQPSGENVVVEAQRVVLEAAGHDVNIIARYTDTDLPHGVAGTVRTGLNVALGTGKSPARELKMFSPDVVHVHNLFPNWGRQWVGDWVGPVVATLHNFRTACASGTFYRDGGQCTSCLDRGSGMSVLHGCYRGSRSATVPLAIATAGGSSRDPVIRRANAVIALSDRAATLHRAAGVPSDKLVVIPNFVEHVPMSRAVSVSAIRSPWIYVGRLSPEKGVSEMVNAWPEDIPLDIYGDGPLMASLRAQSRGNVTFHGAVSRMNVLEALQTAQGLVLPSRWAEGAVPLSYLEAISAGVPVISWTANGAADDIRAAGSGVVIESWDDINSAIRTVEQQRSVFGANGGARFRQSFSPEAWLTQTTRLYESLL